MSSSDLQRRAEEMFVQAVEMPAGERTRFINLQCAGDDELHAEVRLLLKFANDTGDKFLNPAEIRELTIAGTGIVEPMPDEPRLPTGTKLGGYTIRGVLGAGGMGMVYLAEQERPKRTVALKVIRRGMGTSGILRRFEHEAEVLGRLHHPGIAQIYEAGTAIVNDLKQPFISMEYVKGPTLTAYAKEKSLSTRDRLGLLADVCDAVHHAHQRGIIHRDLKPANILVNEVGQPKILDFGVARAMHNDIRVTTMRTSVGQLIGTLAYMSPEQVVGEPAEIDTRSDVYSLGVILYELLAEKLPHDLASCSLPEAARTIRQDPPRKLSVVSKLFRGEIEIIASKALDKEKTRRYQSAAELGQDIRRYLAGDPIHARQDSAMYVLRKQFKRHKWSFAAAVVAILCLVGFSIYAGISERQQRALASDAKSARIEAVQERDKATAANAKLEEALLEAGIDRGQLEAAVGNLPLAENHLWTAYFKNPLSQRMRWALWDLHKRTPMLWTQSCESGAASGVVTPDGTRVLLGLRGGVIVMYETVSGREIGRVKGLKGTINTLEVTADSRWVFAGMTNGRAALLDLNDPAGNVIDLGDKPIHEGSVFAARFDASGKVLVTGGGDKMVRLWDVQTRQLLKEWDSGVAAIGAIAINDAGDQIATGPRLLNEGVSVRVWRLSDSVLLRELSWPQVRAVASMSFTLQDKALLLCARDGVAARADIATGAITPLSIVSNGGFVPPQKSRDSNRLMVGGGESIHLVTDDLKLPPQILGRFRGGLVTAGWVNASSIIVATLDGAIRLVDVTPQRGVKTLAAFRSWVFSVQFSPDGQRMAVAGDGEVHVVRADTLETVFRIKTTEFAKNIGRARSVCYSWDSKTIFAGCADGSIRIMDATSGSVLGSLLSKSGEVYSLALSPDDNTIAVGHASGLIELWDIKTATLTRTLAKQARRIEGLSFSKDGLRLVSSGPSSAAQVWDVATGEPREKLVTSGDSWNVAFNPANDLIFATTYEGTIDVFNAATGELVESMVGHGRLIPGLAFSSDGKYFATCGEDGTVKLWDAQTRRVLVSFAENDGYSLVGLAFDPSNRYLATTASRQLCMIYDLHAMNDCIKGNVEYQRQRLKLAPASSPE